MKFSAKHSIEPLEARIAPARTIIAGVPNNLPNVGNDVDYTDTYAPKRIDDNTVINDPIQAALDDAIFLDTEVLGPTDTKIAGRVGPGVPNLADTFYLRMSAGDVLKIFNTQSSTSDPYLTVTSGNIIAFFVDKDLDNEVDDQELTGIAMGKNAKIILKSGVTGDVVTNLNELGTATTADDELDMTGLVSDKQGIGSLQVLGGAIAGSIIAGGNIANVTVSGTVGAILAGSAADGKAFDFFPNVDGGSGVLNVTPGVGKTGPSISNIFVNGLGTPGALGTTLNGAFNGFLEAGDGGEGGKGGTVSFVRIYQDADGLYIFCGAGGAAGSTKTSGGAGGAVSRIYIGGFPDPFSTVDNIIIQGGAGGDSAVSKGGAGGALKDIFVGYQFFGTKPLPTDELLIDRVQVLGGTGGAGKIGGAGGAITNADIRVETSEGTGDEIVLKGGAGGANLVSGGKAGAGGSLLNISVRNQDLGVGAAYADTLLQGGNGGTTVPGGSGAAGGNVTNVSLLSWELAVVGGNGSDGKVGGAGGSISKVKVTESDEILAIGARFDAGFGGAGSAGNGAKGGDINGVLFTNSDLRDLLFNSGTSAGNGGASLGGKGGAGGTVQNIDIRDGNVSNGATQTPLLQPASVRTGSGGDGTKGGGVGGLMKNLSIDSTNMSVVLSTGAGGDAAGTGAKGAGGAGGNIDVVSVTTRDLVGGLPAFVNATAGEGGMGAGTSAGGAGGDVKFTLLVSNGSAFVRAGAGGAGVPNSGTVKGGAAGRGGNIIATQLTAENGDGELRAGNAGATGGKAGLGGSVMGQNADTRSGLFAHNNLLIQAGNGTAGGAGGSIKFVGYGSGTVTLTPTPMGNIVIKAGDGSAEGKIAGAGGSIFDLSGSLPSQDPSLPTDVIFSTSITAGAGGSTALRGGAGGSISEVAILSGGYAGSILTVQAGDAGDSPNATAGAKGGDVKNVTVSSVDLGTIFRSVVAGDGGDALNKGGSGGNVDSIFVDNIDIGDRRDVPFGLTQMGGIFAGKTGSTLSKTGAAQREGVNGKVTNIVAKGIASIVAGRDIIPEAVELVDKVTLSGDNMLVASENVFTGHGAFRLSYKASVTAAETTQGDGTTQEVQTITLGVLQAPGSTTMVYTYGDKSTPALAGDATPAQVEAALNGLTTIQAAGGVTVTAGTGGFVITFNSTGDKTGVVSAVVTSETAILGTTATAAQVKAALDALPTIQYLGKDNPNTPANEEHTGGTVTVSGHDGSFYVTFNQSGNVIPIEGIEVFNAAAVATKEGSITDVLAVEQIPGASPIPVTELQSGGVSLFVEEFFKGTPSDKEIQDFAVGSFLTVPGAQVQFGFTTAFPFVEATPGDAATREVQTIDLTAVKADARSTFNISFGGATTATLPSTATGPQIQAAINAMTPVVAIGQVSVGLLPTNVLQITFNQFGVRPEFTGTVTSTSALVAANSTDVQFEAALNSMAPIRFTALDRKAGSVDVAPIPQTTDGFFVNFNEFGDQPLLTVNTFAQERQEIESDPLDADPLGDFTLSFSRTYDSIEAVKGNGTRERQDITLGPVFGAGPGTTFTITYTNPATNTVRTSAVLPASANNGQIQAAINAMGIGQVTVAPITANGTIQILFNVNGDNPGTFSATATSVTAPLSAAATESEVQTALNGLATIKGPGAVAETVTVIRQNVPPDVIDNDFEVTFQTSGSRAMIVASVLTQEEQHVDASSIFTEPTGSFRLGFGGKFTDEFDATATAAEVQTELNALTTVQTAGGVVVTKIDSGVFDIRFNNAGPQNEIDIRYEVDEVQRVDFAPNKDLTISVVNDVTAVETVPGAPGLNEVQTLTMGEVIGSAAEFTITYDDGVNPAETTSVLTGQSTPAQIQAALEQLTPIGVGGVAVTVANGEIKVTFQIDGDQPALLTAHATQSTVVAAGSTAQQIEDAMNLLGTVKASGADATGGSVDVALGTGSSMSVRFSSGGDQPLVVVTQEQPLNVFEIRQGGQVATEIQAFSPKPTGQPTDTAYAIANLIGFYSDHSELDANIFQFIKAGVGPTSSLTHVFEPGDQPIDGILFAKKVNQGSLNVVPEAYRIGDVFFDWNNII